mmetsp:Transcript_67786/g.107448  ORF Transcript_67786/g.107448 Transcript_67786/m.107448 type:complete len:901 (-) Transcript_67786:48-2750(-)
MVLPKEGLDLLAKPPGLAPPAEDAQGSNGNGWQDGDRWQDRSSWKGKNDSWQDRNSWKEDDRWQDKNSWQKDKTSWKDSDEGAAPFDFKAVCTGLMGLAKLSWPKEESIEEVRRVYELVQHQGLYDFLKSLDRKAVQRSMFQNALKSGFILFSRSQQDDVYKRLGSLGFEYKREWWKDDGEDVGPKGASEDSRLAERTSQRDDQDDRTDGERRSSYERWGDRSDRSDRGDRGDGGEKGMGKQGQKGMKRHRAEEEDSVPKQQKENDPLAEFYDESRTLTPKEDSNNDGDWNTWKQKKSWNSWDENISDNGAAHLPQTAKGGGWSSEEPVADLPVKPKSIAPENSSVSSAILASNSSVSPAILASVAKGSATSKSAPAKVSAPLMTPPPAKADALVMTKSAPTQSKAAPTMSKAAPVLESAPTMSKAAPVLESAPPMSKGVGIPPGTTTAKGPPAKAHAPLPQGPLEDPSELPAKAMPGSAPKVIPRLKPLFEGAAGVEAKPKMSSRPSMWDQEAPPQSMWDEEAPQMQAQQTDQWSQTGPAGMPSDLLQQMQQKLQQQMQEKMKQQAAEDRIKQQQEKIRLLQQKQREQEQNKLNLQKQAEEDERQLILVQQELLKSLQGQCKKQMLDWQQQCKAQMQDTLAKTPDHEQAAMQQVLMTQMQQQMQQYSETVQSHMHSQMAQLKEMPLQQQQEMLKQMQLEHGEVSQAEQQAQLPGSAGMAHPQAGPHAKLGAAFAAIRGPHMQKAKAQAAAAKVASMIMSGIMAGGVLPKTGDAQLDIISSFAAKVAKAQALASMSEAPAKERSDLEKHIAELSEGNKASSSSSATPSFAKAVEDNTRKASDDGGPAKKYPKLSLLDFLRQQQQSYQKELKEKLVAPKLFQLEKLRTSHQAETKDSSAEK